jgi:hypothetical protein
MGDIMRRTTANLKKSNWFSKARSERLNREIALLESMDATLWRKMMGCAALTILGMASGFLGLGYVLHIQWGVGLAIPVCLGVASLLYVFSRYEYGLFWLFTIVVVGLLIALIFDGGDVPDLGNIDTPDLGERKPDRKAERQAKLRHAIVKRKQRLQSALQKF